MAQWDLLLTQNVHATLTEYSERFVNIVKGGLLSSDGTNVPTVLAVGTNDYVLVADSAETTGLRWADPATFGVSVANQANDRLVTATATADALNAEENLTYNTTQGLYIGSGLGILFAAAATTYSVYTPAGAVKSNITIQTGTNSAGGAGDVTIQAGAGTAAGGNVYFRRDITYGNFYFGTGAAGQLPTRAAETDVVYYNSTTGQLSYGSVTATAPWQVNSNLITTATAGDDMRLANGERLYIGDSGTSYITAGAAGASPPVNIYDGAVLVFSTQATYISTIHHRPLSTTNYDIGASTNYWRYVYAQRWYSNSTTEYIEGSAGAIDVYVGNTHVFRYVTLTGTHVTYNDILAGGTGLDIGDTAQPFQSVAANRYYVGDTLAYIEETGTGATLDILFVSTLAGSVSLNSLSGAGSSNVSVANQANNRVVTATATTDALNSEANLTFNGSTLDATGNVFIRHSSVPMNFQQTGAVAGNIYYARMVVDGATLRYDICVDDDGVFTPYQTPISMVKSAAVTLYYNTTVRLATSTSGVTVTGTMAATAITVTSTSVVTNLNADRVDSLNASDFLRSNASDSATGNILFSGSNNVSGGYLRFYDLIPAVFGSNSDYDIYYNGTTNHLHVDGVSANSDILFSTGGTVRFTFNMGDYKGTATDWIATSDIRLKTKIQPFYLDMDKFLKLSERAIRHNWKAEYGPINTPEIGFVAQDLEKFFPELVTIGTERPHLRGISYGKLVTVAIKATAHAWVYAKEIDARVIAVKSEVDQLKDRVEELEVELNKLQKNG